MISKIKEIFKWRQLIFSLAFKDLKTKFRRAIGGFGWMLIMPIVQMIVFSFVFRFLFKIKIENYPLFLLSGLFAWSFLKSSLDGAANSILNNANLIKKNYFPRQILPISNILVNLITFLFSIIILCVFSMGSKISLFPALLWLPLIVFVQMVLILGISLLFCGLNTMYRESQFIMDILLLIWFYATPVVYPIELVKNAMPDTLFTIYKLNPIVGIIVAYQNIFLKGIAPDINLLFSSLFLSIFIFIFGMAIFNRYEEVFVDII